MTIATATLPESVQLPQYDRSQLRSRIVHLALARFIARIRPCYRSGAERQRRRLGICEISLFSGDRLMSQLRSRTTCSPCWKKAPRQPADCRRRRSRMPECKAGLAGRDY
jgi:hypothetical protein